MYNIEESTEIYCIVFWGELQKDLKILFRNAETEWEDRKLIWQSARKSIKKLMYEEIPALIYLHSSNSYINSLPIP